MGKGFPLVVALLVHLVSISPAISAEEATPKWELAPGSRLEMVRTARVKMLRNNVPVKHYEERNIIDLTCDSKVSTGSHVQGLFRVYVRAAGETVFMQEKEYPSEFIIAPDGKYLVPQGMFMPNLRHIPSFGKETIHTGDSWTGDGELILDTFSRAFKLMFPVNYTLLAVQERDGKKTAIISYNYSIEKILTEPGYPDDFPLKISGQNVGNIFWNLDDNCPASIRDTYRMAFFFAQGDGGIEKLEFVMSIDTDPRVYAPVTQDEKLKARDELKKALPENSGMDVDLDKRGLVVRMGEILFDFDSDRLKDLARDNLERLLEVIRQKYPDRELLVEGHTDSTGTESYNYDLSMRRARSVAGYMGGKIPHDRLSYKGYGPARPMADNATPEGRKKNRRVEIIIKLNGEKQETPSPVPGK